MRAAGSVITAVNAARWAEARHARIAASAARFGIAIDLARDIEHAAVAEGIDPELAFRLVRVESSFRERAVSPAGAIGLTQLMPATADWLQPGITREEIFERDANLRLGFRYLRLLLRVYDGRIEEALHAYNRGPGTVDRIRAAGGDPSNGYAERVLGRLQGEVYSGSGLLPRDRLRGRISGP
jgi:soluble lytic murein transglycosylase-like protein